MKIVIRILLPAALLNLSMPTFSNAQETHTASELATEQTQNFFKDGVYFTLQDLQHNTPSLRKEQLISSYYDNTGYSISRWSDTQNMFYTDKEGVKRKAFRDSVWGYVENGTPYIMLNGRFHRFSTTGSVSVFVERYPSITAGYAPVVTEARAGAVTNLFILSTGEIMEFTPANVALAISGNEPLYEEFMAIKSGKMKRRKMYRFVERYNEQYSVRRN